jgi:hypothetical protein
MFARKWIELKTVILSKKSQRNKNIVCSPLYPESRSKKKKKE